jgi:hypothetical protein
MGYSQGYGFTPEDKQSIELIKKAYEYGCTFLILQKYMEMDIMKK